jgi:hypothetical protein
VCLLEHHCHDSDTAAIIYGIGRTQSATTPSYRNEISTAYLRVAEENKPYDDRPLMNMRAAIHAIEQDVLIDIS